MTHALTFSDHLLPTSYYLFVFTQLLKNFILQQAKVHLRKDVPKVDVCSNAFWNHG